MKKTMRAPMNGPSKSTNKNVEMVKKNPENWGIIPGPIGRYTYKLVDTKISGVFNGHGLIGGKAYTLVSYKGGDKVVVLGSGTANDNGDLHIISDPVDVGSAQEWTGDYLGQPAGYKIWLVPGEHIAIEKLTWHPNAFLFERSLAR